jgi:hypothetical protein
VVSGDRWLRRRRSSLEPRPVVALVVHIVWKVAHRREGEGLADVVQRPTALSGLLFVALVVFFISSSLTGALDEMPRHLLALKGGCAGSVVLRPLTSSPRRTTSDAGRTISDGEARRRRCTV